MLRSIFRVGLLTSCAIVLTAFGQTAPTLVLKPGYVQKTVATVSENCTGAYSAPVCAASGDPRIAGFMVGNFVTEQGLMIGLRPASNPGEIEVYTVTPDGLASTLATFTNIQTCSVTSASTAYTQNTAFFLVGYNLIARALYVRIEEVSTAYQYQAANGSFSCLPPVPTPPPGTTISSQSVTYLIKVTAR
jgi:hypothetical protein